MLIVRSTIDRGEFRQSLGPPAYAMSPGSRNHVSPLIVAGEGSAGSRRNAPNGGTESDGGSSACEQDWSTLMARAQGGDRDAYRRLLEEITPYLRSLASKRHRLPSDVEDAVQDVLLTVHAIRHTYDPSRPFGPWLVAIARRRIIDRLRRASRLRARETVLGAGHETFPAPQPNLLEATSDGRMLR